MRFALIWCFPCLNKLQYVPGIMVTPQKRFWLSCDRQLINNKLARIHFRFYGAISPSGGCMKCAVLVLEAVQKTLKINYPRSVLSVLDILYYPANLTFGNRKESQLKDDLNRYWLIFLLWMSVLQVSTWNYPINKWKEDFLLFNWLHKSLTYYCL